MKDFHKLFRGSKNLQWPYNIFMEGLKCQMFNQRVTVKEASEYLKLSERNVQHYSNKGYLPNQSGHRSLLFKMSDVLKLNIYLGDGE